MLAGLDHRFLDRTPKAEVTTKIIDKLDYIKIENINAADNIIKELGKKTTNWEARFANNISNKGLVS